MRERSVRRQAIELLGVLVLVAVVLFGVFGLMGYAVIRAADETVTHLDKSTRAEIDQANCTRLRSMFTDRRGSIDSTNSAVEAVEAIVKRSEKLHCDPPIRLPRVLRTEEH